MKYLILLFTVISYLSAPALTKEEAADFLFGTLSLPDRADYPAQFYIDNIEASFKAREEMSWGNTVPDKEFLHFVLPVRVNNESLDGSRIVFYDELKERVKGLTMEEAILEVNHWCHEHVTYQPSDGRTSSPLSTLSQAIGRCGEESTFTVAALRSVGIPARQIYTPRWAHTDDNHAWVEAWANGKWYFIGACEPEPVLNMAWFNMPASRGLLMTTNVAGEYPGPEEILSAHPLTTSINVTANYTPVDTLKVKVRYQDGAPVENARVTLCIYNYAEYYPAVSKLSSESGEVSFTSGLGDAIIWATDGELFGFVKGNPLMTAGSGNEPVAIVLDKDASHEGAYDFYIVPPVSSGNLPEVEKWRKEVNESRKAEEDSIRKNYTDTFIKDWEIKKLASEKEVDGKVLSKILKESRGNHKMLSQMLLTLAPEYREKFMALLSAVTEKDRRDITEEAVLDHILCTPSADSMPYIYHLPLEMRDSIYKNFILNPRIETEFIRPWRSVLTAGFDENRQKVFNENPDSLCRWIADNITLSENENPRGLRMSPTAVWHERKADSKSREIFFVASARASGIPSRIDLVTGHPQFLDKSGEWIDVNLESNNLPGNQIILAQKEENPDNASNYGTLKLTFTPDGYLKDPKYYSNFTVSRIENGMPHLLEYSEEATYEKNFSDPVKLEEGQYMLTTGLRLADGAVLAHSEIFMISPDVTTEVPLIIRKDDSKLSVIGSLNAENLYHDLSGATDKSLLSTAGRGYYTVGFISPNHEPSEHALNELSAFREELEKDGRIIILLFEDMEAASRFDKSRFPDLPSNIVFGIDNGAVSKNEVLQSLNLATGLTPLFIVTDSFNRIVWINQGYSIGTAEKILSVLSRLE